MDKLNTNAGGALDASERQALIDQLTANNTNAGRAAVLRRVADDQNLKDAELNKAFVLMQYFGYLKRNPDDLPDENYNALPLAPEAQRSTAPRRPRCQSLHRSSSTQPLLKHVRLQAKFSPFTRAAFFLLLRILSF